MKKDEVLSACASLACTGLGVPCFLTSETQQVPWLKPVQRRKLLKAGERLRLQQEQAEAEGWTGSLSQPMLFACEQTAAGAGNSRNAWPLGGAAGPAAGTKRRRCGGDGGAGAGE